MRSLVAEPGATARLLSGWHELEEWTWPAQTYDRPGEQVYRRPAPVAVLAGEPAVAEFELDKALPPDGADHRERWLIAVSLRRE